MELNILFICSYLKYSIVYLPLKRPLSTPSHHLHSLHPITERTQRQNFPEDFPAAEFISSLQVAAYQDGADDEAKRLKKTRKASARLPPRITQGKEELQGYIL